MNTLKRNWLPLICCLVYGIDRIGRPLTALSGVAMGLTALYLVVLAINIIRERGDNA